MNQDLPRYVFMRVVANIHRVADFCMNPNDARPRRAMLSGSPNGTTLRRPVACRRSGLNWVRRRRRRRRLSSSLWKKLLRRTNAGP